MKRSLSRSVPFLVLFFLVVARDAYALAPPAAVMAPAAALSFALQLLTALTIFFFVPVAFTGMVLRLVGARKQDKEMKRSARALRALLHFVNLVIYHAAILGAWLAIAHVINTSFSRAGYDEYALYFGPDLWWFMIAYAAASGLAASYVIYALRRRSNPAALRPTASAVARLSFWNAIVVFFPLLYMILT